jgi:hypothetical protein
MVLAWLQLGVAGYGMIVDAERISFRAGLRTGEQSTSQYQRKYRGMFEPLTSPFDFPAALPRSKARSCRNLFRLTDRCYEKTTVLAAAIRRDQSSKPPVVPWKPCAACFRTQRIARDAL